MSLPVIKGPFKITAMDLVNPLMKSAWENQYILMVLDYASRYPDAVPQRKTSSKVTAQELFNMFLRTEFTKQIWTDQGTSMSKGDGRPMQVDPESIIAYLSLSPADTLARLIRLLGGAMC